ncbi:MAG: hypothetical protein IPM34_07800 [Saprospiraceae bacterium]|nr:hypothetical protein [Saprospiraceae bacterium]
MVAKPGYLASTLACTYQNTQCICFGADKECFILQSKDFFRRVLQFKIETGRPLTLLFQGPNVWHLKSSICSFISFIIHFAAS